RHTQGYRGRTARLEDRLAGFGLAAVRADRASAFLVAGAVRTAARGRRLGREQRELHGLEREDVHARDRERATPWSSRRGLKCASPAHRLSRLPPPSMRGQADSSCTAGLKKVAPARSPRPRRRPAPAPIPPDAGRAA